MGCELSKQKEPRTLDELVRSTVDSCISITVNSIIGTSEDHTIKKNKVVDHITSYIVERLSIYEPQSLVYGIYVTMLTYIKENIQRYVNADADNWNWNWNMILSDIGSNDTMKAIFCKYLKFNFPAIEPETSEEQVSSGKRPAEYDFEISGDTPCKKFKLGKECPEWLCCRTKKCPGCLCCRTKKCPGCLCCRTKDTDDRFSFSRASLVGNTCPNCDCKCSTYASMDFSKKACLNEPLDKTTKSFVPFTVSDKVSHGGLDFASLNKPLDKTTNSFVPRAVSDKVSHVSLDFSKEASLNKPLDKTTNSFVPRAVSDKVSHVSLDFSKEASLNKPLDKTTNSFVPRAVSDKVSSFPSFNFSKKSFVPEELKKKCVELEDFVSEFEMGLKGVLDDVQGFCNKNFSESELMGDLTAKRNIEMTLTDKEGDDLRCALKHMDLPTLNDAVKSKLEQNGHVGDKIKCNVMYDGHANATQTVFEKTNDPCAEWLGFRLGEVNIAFKAQAIISDIGIVYVKTEPSKLESITPVAMLGNLDFEYSLKTHQAVLDAFKEITCTVEHYQSSKLTEEREDGQALFGHGITLEHYQSSKRTEEREDGQALFGRGIMLPTHLAVTYSGGDEIAMVFRDGDAAAIAHKALGYKTKMLMRSSFLTCKTSDVKMVTNLCCRGYLKFSPFVNGVCELYRSLLQ